MSKLILSLSIIAGGLSVGYVIQQLVNARRLHLPISLETLRINLQKGALLFVLPITIIGSIWVTKIESAAIAALPLLGFGAIMLGGGLSLVAARLLKLPPHKAGALYGCGSFTNIGAIGGLVCYVFLGETGFALVPIYKIFEELTYYGIGFPIAKYHSRKSGTHPETTAKRIKETLTDPFILVAFASIFLGAIFNFTDIPRPPLFGLINTLFIPLGTGMLLTSIGLSMKFRRVTLYYRECLAVSAIKFAFVPLTIVSIAYLLGYGEIEQGMPLKVVIILACMPPAFNALIPPSIYDLDLDLANACWFFNTACLVWVLPVLLFVVKSF